VIFPDPFCAAIGLGGFSTWVFGGLGVLSLGNSLMKLASPAKLSRNPIELRSEVEISEAVALAVVVPGLETAGGISEYLFPFWRSM
jgi:hypothetical protein